MKNDSTGVVYFIRLVAGDFDFVKIGYSADHERRLDELQRCNPFPLQLLGTIRGSFALEHRIKQRFSRLRVRGEWYRFDDQLATFIACYLGLEAAA